jgi:hypothetical protein
MSGAMFGLTLKHKMCNLFSNIFQGGAKFPTGGNHSCESPRAPFLTQERVSRFGEKPKPTVIVRMKEDVISEKRINSHLLRLR